MGERLTVVESNEPSQVILAFDGAYRYLSNFYPSQIWFDGHEYPTVEHAFQAAKTLVPDDRQWVRSSDSPGQAKRRGNRVTLRPLWNVHRLHYMKAFVRQKFTRHEDLRRQLLATGDAELREGNTWGDTFWGVSLATNRGENHLGRILMAVRSELRNR